MKSPVLFSFCSALINFTELKFALSLAISLYILWILWNYPASPFFCYSWVNLWIPAQGIPLEAQIISHTPVMNYWYEHESPSDEERRLMLVTQSGLLKILDLAKTAPAESRLDEISLLLAIKGNYFNFCMHNILYRYKYWWTWYFQSIWCGVRGAVCQLPILSIHVSMHSPAASSPGMFTLEYQQ